MKKTAIVTGATGFIGSYLVRYLLKNKYTVIGIGRDREKLESFMDEEKFIPLIAGFEKYENLDKLVRINDIDIFFHMAWEGGFTDSLRDYNLQFNNAKAACDAISSAIKLKCRKFVYAGTTNEIEINQFINNKNFIPRNACIYASCKVAADMICRTLAYEKIEYNSCLIPLPYGIGNNSKQLINVLIKNCMDGKPTRLIQGDNLYDIAHIDDIIKAIYIIGENGHNMKSYYIGHRELRTFKEICENIRDIINPAAPLLFGEYDDSLNMDYNYTDVNALYNDTGFECRSNLKKTIKEQAEWLKQIGYEN